MSSTKNRRPGRTTSDKQPRKRREPLRPITALHQASYAALAPLVNIFDPGVKDQGDGVIHTLPKEYWSLNGRARLGEKNLSYNGRPWNRSSIGRNIFNVGHVRDHIEGRAIHYFTGGKVGMTTFMLDHDEHEPWQKGLARKAWDILAEYWRAYFGTEPYNRDSTGGYHAYPVLSYPLDFLDKDKSYEAVNLAYRRLQHVVGLLLRAKGNYSIFEVKGTITTKARSGSLAKLPLCTWLPYVGRDSWNLDHLRRFREQRIITLDELNGCVEYLADIVAQQPQLLDHHRRIKAAIQEQYRKQQETVPAAREQAVAAANQGPDEKIFVPSTGQPPTPPTASVAVRPSSRLKARLRNLDLDLDAENPDSRQREHRVLMAAARQLGRVPGISEALDILDQPDHYWNDKRRNRVAGTLRFISRTFDSEKRKASGGKPDLDLDKYTQTFRHRYPGRKVDPAKLSAFVVGLKWSLEHQDRGDGSVPRSRILKLTGLTTDMYQKLARFAVREGIFECDLFDYGQDQARRWRIGNQFPGREWWRRKNNASLRSMRSIELRRGKFVVAPLRSAPLNLPLSGLVGGEAARGTATTHTPYHNSLVWKRSLLVDSERLLWECRGRGPPESRFGCQIGRPNRPGQSRVIGYSPPACTARPKTGGPGPSERSERWPASPPACSEPRRGERKDSRQIHVRELVTCMAWRFPGCRGRSAWCPSGSRTPVSPGYSTPTRSRCTSGCQPNSDQSSALLPPISTSWTCLRQSFWLAEQDRAPLDTLNRIPTRTEPLRLMYSGKRKKMSEFPCDLHRCDVVSLVETTMNIFIPLQRHISTFRCCPGAFFGGTNEGQRIYCRISGHAGESPPAG